MKVPIMNVTKFAVTVDNKVILFLIERKKTLLWLKILKICRYSKNSKVIGINSIKR